MSRPGVLVGLGLSLAMTVGVAAQVAAQLPAQAPEGTAEARLARMIDSLAPLVEQAAVEAEAARRARMEEARRRSESRLDLDTLRVGQMTIIAPVADASDARELFGEVWRESFADVESRTLSERVFTFQRALYDVEEIPVDGERHQVVIAEWHTRERARARVRHAIGQAISAELSRTRLASWTTGSPFASRDPARLYRELIVARSLAARRCLEGSVGSCTAALGLRTDDDVLDVWYTPEERRELVLSWADLRPTLRQDEVPRRARDLYGAAIVDCVRLSTDDACDAFIDPRLDMWAPLPTYMRETVVAVALRRGGPGAWTRLVEDPDRPPEEALADAAGVPLDTLVAEWRAWLVGNRPEAHAGLGGSSALTLLWILLFAALATRSTRWRFD